MQTDLLAKVREGCRERQARYRARHPERIREYKVRAAEKIKQSAVLYRFKNLDRERAKGKRLYEQRRKAIFEFFGSQCCRCGFADLRALQVDHINGGGSRERKGKEMSYIVTRMISSNPDAVRARYQLLCANCNVIKRVENGEHGGLRVYTPRLTTASTITED